MVSGGTVERKGKHSSVPSTRQSPSPLQTRVIMKDLRRAQSAIIRCLFYRTTLSSLLKRTRAGENSRRARQAFGLCSYGLCSAQVMHGKTYCTEHLDRMRMKATERRLNSDASGLCVCCGQRPQFWAKYCVICRDKRGQDPYHWPHGEQ